MQTVACPYHLSSSCQGGGNCPTVTKLLERAYVLCDSRSWERTRLLELLEIPYGPGRRWPSNRFGRFELEGLHFELKLGNPNLTPKTGYANRHRSAKHRLFITCPDCTKLVPVGRMQQHTPIHGVGRPPGYHRAGLKKGETRNGSHVLNKP